MRAAFHVGQELVLLTQPPCPGVCLASKGQEYVNVYPLPKGIGLRVFGGYGVELV